MYTECLDPPKKVISGGTLYLIVPRMGEDSFKGAFFCSFSGSGPERLSRVGCRYIPKQISDS